MVLATIKDVAKLAGVSLSTASYALNGSNKVSEKTKEKVLEAAKKLNYVPNNLAQNLKKSKTDLIALIVHEINGPFYDRLVKGIQDVAYMFGYNLLIFCESGYGRASSISFLKEKIVDGAIIMTPIITDSDIIEISNEDFPIVLLDRKLDGLDLCSVLIDNEKGAFEAVKHLVDLGHKKIGFISGVKESYDNICRFQGYVKAIENFELELNENFVLNGDFTEQSGYEAIKNFMENSDDVPTAFFAANDEMAIGAIRALKEKGLEVPKDISIVGFDDILAASYIEPKLTTIRRPMYELGSFSAHMLFNLIKRNIKGSNITLDVELVIRDSTAERKG